jgi:hypothetical protein
LPAEKKKVVKISGRLKGTVYIVTETQFHESTADGDNTSWSVFSVHADKKFADGVAEAGNKVHGFRYDVIEKSVL